MPLPSSWQAFRGGAAARPFIVYGSGVPVVSRTAVVSVPLRFAVARPLLAIANRVSYSLMTINQR